MRDVFASQQTCLTMVLRPHLPGLVLAAPAVLYHTCCPEI